MSDEDRMQKLSDGLRYLQAEVSEVHTQVMGPLPLRNNGLNSVVKKLVKEHEEWNENVWQVKRKEGCHGLEECHGLREEVRLMREEMKDMGVAKTNLRGVYVMSILQFLGMIIVALIAGGVFH